MLQLVLLVGIYSLSIFGLSLELYNYCRFLCKGDRVWTYNWYTMSISLCLWIYYYSFFFWLLILTYLLVSIDFYCSSIFGLCYQSYWTSLSFFLILEDQTSRKILKTVKDLEYYRSRLKSDTNTKHDQRRRHVTRTQNLSKEIFTNRVFYPI